MINAIIGAISSALFEEFGYENHMEEIKQDLQEPCFFISCINPTFRRYMGKRFFRQNKFCIQYFPKSEGAAKEECYSVAERMNFCLEVIQVMGKPIRGTEITYEVTDGVLHYFVNYDCFVYRMEHAESMDSMRSKINVKG